MARYYYAPVFVADGPQGQPQYEPGYLDGAGELVSAVALLPPSTKVPVYDRDIPRMVVEPGKTTPAWKAPEDWKPAPPTDVAEQIAALTGGA